MSGAPPSSPAGAPVRIEPPSSSPPPRPRLSHLPGILLSGLPTLLFSALMAGALTMPFVRPPARVLEVVVFTVVPAMGLAVFVRRWWASIRALGDEAPSWSALMVPFFVVAGAAGGVLFIAAAAARG